MTLMNGDTYSACQTALMQIQVLGSLILQDSSYGWNGLTDFEPPRYSMSGLVYYPQSCQYQMNGQMGQRVASLKLCPTIHAMVQKKFHLLIKFEQSQTLKHCLVTMPPISPMCQYLILGMIRHEQMIPEEKIGMTQYLGIMGWSAKLNLPLVPRHCIVLIPCNYLMSRYPMWVLPRLAPMLQKIKSWQSYDSETMGWRYHRQMSRKTTEPM